MPHDVTLIATFALGFALAFAFGYLANRLRLPPLVGYLVAGVVIGVYAPGAVADSATAGQLAEIGVILLMFGVGLHFSIDDLMAVRRIVFPGAIAQIVLATAIGTGLALAWGWSLGGGIVLGLCLSVASTVVLLKALEERNGVATLNGRIAVGWLIVEDLAMVLVLVLLPALAGVLGGQDPGSAHGGESHGLLVTLGLTLLKVAAFGAIVLLLGPRVLPWVLRQVARTGSRELFTLAVLVAVGRHRVRLRRALRRLVRAGSVLRRRRAQRVRPLAQGGDQLAAAAGCVRGPVLRLGRDAVRPVDHRARAVDAGRRAALDPGRQVADRAGGRPAAGLPVQHRADGVGGAGADRRVLLHPRRPRHQLRPAAQGGPLPDPRRRDPVDHHQQADVHRRRLDHALDARRARAAVGASAKRASRRSTCCTPNSTRRTSAPRRRPPSTGRSPPRSSSSAFRCSPS